jgi:hypothetical protein
VYNKLRKSWETKMIEKEKETERERTKKRTK